MTMLADALNADGYTTINVPYFSFTRTFRRLTTDVRGLLEVELLGNDQPVHFVTHSMGGNLVRYLLEGWQPTGQAGHIVMLGPPNRGSAVVEWALDCWLVRWVFGPAGQKLTRDFCTEEMPRLCRDDGAFPVHIVMGNLRQLPVLRRLIEVDHDGILFVERGHLAGEASFQTIPVEHGFMPSYRRTHAVVLSLLDAHQLKSSAAKR